jgi:hypothetical protein
MLDSVLVGIALLGSGALLIGVCKGAVVRGLSLVLLCSILLNLSLLNHCYLAGKFMLKHLDLPPRPASAPSSVSGAKTSQAKLLGTAPTEALTVLSRWSRQPSLPKGEE